MIASMFDVKHIQIIKHTNHHKRPVSGRRKTDRIALVGSKRAADCATMLHVPPRVRLLGFALISDDVGLSGGLLRARL